MTMIRQSLTSLILLQFFQLYLANSTIERGTNNFKTLTWFNYDGKQIYVYSSTSNAENRLEPKLWKFFYVPVMQKVQMIDGRWISVENSEIRMKFIIGDLKIEAEARKAISKKYNDDDVVKYAQFWDVAPLIIDSLVAYVVRGSDSPVEDLLPFHLIHENALTITCRFECTTEKHARNIMEKLLNGYYQVIIALHIDGFFNKDSNMISVTSNQLKSILTKTIVDGGNTNAQFIHRNQAMSFVARYLNNVKKIIFAEDYELDVSATTAGLNEQFFAMFQQGVENATETKLPANLYNQVWQSADFNPDRFIRELNKVFTYNDSATQLRGNHEKYFNFNKKIAWNYAELGSNNILFQWKWFGRSTFLEMNDETHLNVMSETDVKQFINQQFVEIAWEGDKFVPKVLRVVKLTDVVDRMQMAIVTKQLVSERSRGAILRTISALDESLVFSPTPLGLFTGEIRLYASSSTQPPINWLRCNGSRVSRIQYSRLFAVIGTTYDVNNNDSTTFQLPDLRGRTAIGRDVSAYRMDLARTMGATGGQTRQTLTTDQLPSHSHDDGTLTTVHSGSHSHGYTDPGHSHATSIRENGGTTENTYFFTATSGAHGWYPDRVRTNPSVTGITISPAGDHSHLISGYTGSTGSGNSFSILNPYQVLDYIIYAA